MGNLLTVQQAAEALSLCPKTLRNWIAMRRIGVVRVGGRAVRIPAQEVSRLVEEGSVPARRERP